MSLLTVIDATQEDAFGLIARIRVVPQSTELADQVAAIIARVAQCGDDALLESARQFDAPEMEGLLVSDAEIQSHGVAGDELAAIESAYQAVRTFHERQLAAMTAGWEWRDGYWAWQTGEGFAEGSMGQKMKALGSVGVYVPGGQANYPSSVLMNAVPALVAGVPRLTITTPARRDGNLSPYVLAAIATLKRHHDVEIRVAKVGGAAAIAGLALGTASIPRVEKIVGPGNQWVNEAKRQFAGRVGLDGYAGPSEVAVLADETANPAFAAADLLTQVEHAEDNAGFLVCISRTVLDSILVEAETQLVGAPREATMRAALKQNSFAFIARDLDHAVGLVNAIAPEHLAVAVKHPESLVGRIDHAGCMMLGEWTPESAGDFAAGPSHTLPTAGAARFQSPVNVADFVKFQSVVNLSKAQLAELNPVIQAFGAMEGFPAHAAGATIRIQ